MPHKQGVEWPPEMDEALAVIVDDLNRIFEGT
jgi:hypothetical protein